MKMSEFTVGDLIGELEGMDPNAKIRMASQPAWPFEYSIDMVAESGGVVYIGEGTQLGYLPSGAASALGWRE